MGILRRGRKEVTWKVVPSGHPLAAQLAQPGEEILEPALGVIDWQQYLATIDERPRRRAIGACARDLVMTDRRLLIFRSDGTLRRHELPLASIRDVSLVRPPGKVAELGECAIRVVFVAGEETRYVDYSTRRSDAEPFVERLRRLIGKVRLDAFADEHGEGISLDDADRMSELLRLMHEAGEYELPPIVSYPEAEAGVAAPVASLRRCPQCGGDTSSVSDALACRRCSLIWCDPGREPDVRDGRLIGTQRFLPMSAEIANGDSERVRCFYATREGVL